MPGLPSPKRLPMVLLKLILRLTATVIVLFLMWLAIILLNNIHFPVQSRAAFVGATIGVLVLVGGLLGLVRIWRRRARGAEAPPRIQPPVDHLPDFLRINDDGEAVLDR